MARLRSESRYSERITVRASDQRLLQQNRPNSGLKIGGNPYRRLSTLSFYATKDGKTQRELSGMGSVQGRARWATLRHQMGTAGGRGGASSMRIRAGLLTLKMTPSFIRAHGTGLRA